MLSLLLAAFTLPCVLSPAPVGQVFGGEWNRHLEVSGLESAGLFGRAVSGGGDLDGDGCDDLLVGSYAASPGGVSMAGSVFAYSGATGSLLYRFDGAIYQGYLGYAVALVPDANGDGFDDMLYSEPRATANGIPLTGSVFLRSGADGSLLRRFDGVEYGDSFGVSLDDIGDFDGDGLPDLIFSGIGRTVASQIRVGVVLVHSGATGLELRRFEGTPGSSFGSSVACAGDVDADGLDDIIVGDYAADVGGFIRAGSAFVYSGATGLLLHRFDGWTDGFWMGYSVSGAGDVDLDGAADLIIGAILADTDAGAAFVHSGRTGALLHEFRGQRMFGYFGDCVAGAGDVDLDGVDDVVIGAPAARPGGIKDAGSASIFSGATGALLHRLDGLQDDWLGDSVSGAGDLNGDGFADVLVGAIGAESGGIVNAGQVTVFGLNPWIRTSSFTISDAANTRLRLDLDFPDAAAGCYYRVLLSKAGRGPTFHGVQIPLTVDPLFIRTLHGGYPAQGVINMQGFLDLNGDATAGAWFPAGGLNARVGSTVFLAAVAAAPGSLPGFSTAAIPLTITP